MLTVAVYFSTVSQLSCTTSGCISSSIANYLIIVYLLIGHFALMILVIIVNTVE